MESVIKLQHIVNGDVVPFPNEEEQVIITSFDYSAERMGGAPTISAKVMHPLCLDNYWHDYVFGEFNGERYYIRSTPSSSKDNEDARYEHYIELISEREALDNVYFIDAVQGDSEQDIYKSNSTSVVFFGDIQEFVKRINYSMQYSEIDYSVVIDEGITSEEKLVSIEDMMLSEVLQEIFNTFELPYYFVGKIIHVGFTENAITHEFKYGRDESLVSISKENANYAIVNRCSGRGSSQNIPFYYPNPSNNREEIEAAGGTWITPVSTLMPPIYRESLGAQSFYNALNDTYTNPDTGLKYTFENEYSSVNPHESIVTFEDIYPSIKGMTNASGQRMDMFSEFAWDENDNDDYDEETGDYLHPYFFAKLRKFDGENGFNLFQHAIVDNTPMTISFTSGSCGGCMFEIGVDEEDGISNIVQVGEGGNILRDSEGNVLLGAPQERQQDTQNYEVWIALKKDINTYGTIMPSKATNLVPTSSDTFVILYIELPQSYITNAENRLKEEIIKHMYLNNNERFTFSLEFSRIFFAEHPDILAQMNENARLLFSYNGIQNTLYVNSFAYSMSDDEPLPKISVSLDAELSVGKNSLQTRIDAVKQEIMSSIGSIDFLQQGLKYFLRKDVDDYASGKITFRKGLDVGKYSPLVGGGTFRMNAQNQSYLEVDKLLVRLKATFEELEIKKVSHIGGEQIISAASMQCVLVQNVNASGEVITENTEDKEVNAYRCCFLGEVDGLSVNNEFAVNDLCICKEVGNMSEGGVQISNHYFWRRVVRVNTSIYEIEGDTRKYNYIDLSVSDCDEGSDIPRSSDTIVQLGNTTENNRQNAIISSSVSEDSPSIKLLQGINSYSLDGKEIISQGVDVTSGIAFQKIFGDFYVGDRIDGNENNYVKYDSQKGELEVKGKLIVQGGNQTIEEYTQEQINNLEIGGNNLILNSRCDKEIPVLSTTGGYSIAYTNGKIGLEISDEVLYNGKPTLKLYNGLIDNGELYDGSQRYIQFDRFKRTDNKLDTADYVFSCMMYLPSTYPSGDESEEITGLYCFNGNKSVGLTASYDLTKKGTWQKLVLKVPYNRISSQDDWCFFRIRDMRNSADSSIRNLYVAYIAEIQLIKGNKETTWKPAPEDAQNELKDAIAAEEEARNAALADVSKEMAGLQEQIDGKIESFFGNEDPKLTNEPAATWLKESSEDEHLNDTFTNLITGDSWRWSINSETGTYDWTTLGDYGLSEALKQAGKAQSTADGKSTTYLSKPTSYKVGDLWILESDSVHSPNKAGEILTANKTSSSYAFADWSKKVRYTDDTAALLAQQNAEAAADAAKKAQTDANSANALLSDIANDNKLTPQEKQQAKKEWDAIVAEEPLNEASAKNYGIDTTKYTDAYNKLESYLKPLLENLAKTSDIKGSEFRNVFNVYYTERTNLLNAISSKAKQLADNAQTKADAANTLATQANKAATKAQSAIDAMNNDAIFDVTEKQSIRTEWECISGNANTTTTTGGANGSYKKACLMADSVGLAYGDLTTKFGALRTYLNGLALYTNSNTSGFSRTTLATNFANYYNAETALIAEVQKKIVDDVEIGGTNLLKNTDGLNSARGYTIYLGATVTYGTVTVTEFGNISCGTVKSSGGSSTLKIFKYLSTTRTLIEDKVYTTSAWVKNLSDSETLIVKMNGFYTEINNTIWPEVRLAPLEAKRVSLTGYRNTNTIQFQLLNSSGADVYAAVWRIKLEEGNKPTAWSPAPEDVEAKISELDYLKEALQGTTEIDGGLLLTNLIKLKNQSNKENGGISGLSNDNVAFWSGGTYEEALNQAAGKSETLPVLITKDENGYGTKFGIFKIVEDGIEVSSSSGDSKVLITSQSIDEVSVIQKPIEINAFDEGYSIRQNDVIGTKRISPSTTKNKAGQNVYVIYSANLGSIGGNYRALSMKLTIKPQVVTMDENSGVGTISNMASITLGNIYFIVKKNNVVIYESTLLSHNKTYSCGGNNGYNGAELDVYIPSKLDFGKGYGNVYIYLCSNSLSGEVRVTTNKPAGVGTGHYAAASISTDIFQLSFVGIDKYVVMARDGIAIIQRQDAYFIVKNPSDSNLLDIRMKGLPTSIALAGNEKGRLYTNNGFLMVVR